MQDKENRSIQVCAYCRVFTDNDKQLSSYEHQQAHYRQLAQKHPTWELKHIFVDQGVSLKSRDAFNEMIEACKRGEYDLILTRNISHFVCSLADCISITRMLKELTPPVGVFFETENLYSLGESSELI